MRRSLVPLKTSLTVLLVPLLLALTAAPVAAQVSVNVSDAADAIQSTGRFVEAGSVSAEVEAAIQRANAQNVAFVWLNQNGEGLNAARSISTELGSRQSRYGAVIVLTESSVFAAGVDEAGPAMNDATTQIFGTGNVAGGIDAYLARLGGAASAGAPSTGGGFPWIIPILLAVFAFIGFRMWSGRRKTKTAESIAIEDDRAEIKEQLKNNADRVMTYGDRVIKSGDAELISMYEEASRTYQDVSQSVDGAQTATEVDLLDDRIDKAEWQFDVIEAKLENRTPPPFPHDSLALDDDSGTPPPPSRGRRTPPPPSRTTSTRSDAPALGRDESVLEGSPSRPQARPRTSQRRRSSGMGGMLTGGMGRMLMSVLASVLLGGGLGQPRTSRRTQRRTGGDLGSILSGGRSSGNNRRGRGGRGGLGGGVLRGR